jgi:hypothetical protein
MNSVVLMQAASLAALIPYGDAIAAGPFEGSFVRYTYINRGRPNEQVFTEGFTLRQHGSRVCGEWFRWTPTRQYQGLLAGHVKQGTLAASLCADPDGREPSTCTHPGDGQAARFKVIGALLKDISSAADGSSIVYRRDASTPLKWVFSANPTPTFLSRCENGA